MNFLPFLPYYLPYKSHHRGRYPSTDIIYQRGTRVGGSISGGWPTIDKIRLFTHSSSLYMFNIITIASSHTHWVASNI